VIGDRKQSETNKVFLTVSLIQKVIKIYFDSRNSRGYGIVLNVYAFTSDKIRDDQFLLKSKVQQKTVGEEKENTVKLECRRYLFPQFSSRTFDSR